MSCRLALPSTETVCSGSVMSWMLAFPLNVAVPVALSALSEVIELLLI